MGSKFKAAGFWMLIGGNALSIIACFLPFVDYVIASAVYIDGEGVFILALNVVAIVMAFVKPRFAFIPNIVSTAWVCITFVDWINAGGLQLLEIGAYLVLAGNIIALFGGVKDK